MAKQSDLRNISTTTTEEYETANGSVRVRREGRSEWVVWPIGSTPRVVRSKAEAFARARLLDADRGGLRDVINATKSASTLDAEIKAFLTSKGHY